MLLCTFFKHNPNSQKKILFKLVSLEYELKLSACMPAYSARDPTQGFTYVR